LALLNAGWARLAAGEVAAAASALRQSLELTATMRNRIDAARALEGLAAVAAVDAEPARGAQLFGAAEAVRRSIGATVWVPDRPGHDRTEGALRGALGAHTFEARFGEGITMSVQDALALATELADGHRRQEAGPNEG
jgi:hypothetical protein